MLVLNSLLLGFGLAMDAFTVSLANGLSEPNLKKLKMINIALIFAIFQGAMPLIGWVFVSKAVKYIRGFDRFVPIIALILLVFIGLKMIFEKEDKDEEEKDKEKSKLTFGVLIVQGIATSIDALSVGFTIADYSFIKSLISSSIIAGVTFIICMIGVLIGKKVGMKYAKKASRLGGCVLIVIGIEIFVKGMFFS